MSNEMKLPPLSSLDWLQGSPAELTHDLRLCVLIQPNCPGCIQHAIPTANNLLLSNHQNFDVYCISTAFENFDLNTFGNANKLLQGQLVGESQRVLGGTTTENGVPVMPLAHDTVVCKSEASESLIALALEATKQNARQQASILGIPSDKLEQVLSQLNSAEVLPEKIARVFYTVRAQGTPTWILHNSAGTVLDCRFGHYNNEQLLDWIHETSVNMRRK